MWLHVRPRHITVDFLPLTACPEVFYSFLINLRGTENSQSPSNFVLSKTTNRPHRYDFSLWVMRRRALLHTYSTPVVLLSWPANVFVTLGFQCSVVLFQRSRVGTEQRVYSITPAHERGESFPIPHDALLMQHADVKLNEEFLL